MINKLKRKIIELWNRLFEDDDIIDDYKRNFCKYTLNK